MSQPSEMSWNGNTGIRYRAPRTGNTAPPVTEPDSTNSQPRDGMAGSETTRSRIPAWGRSTTGNYVTIGSVRYGVRFAATTNSPPREEVPPRGDATNHHAHGDDCCCGVVQLLTPSRIPLPADKTPAINRRGIFSRINSGEPTREPLVYRSTLEWSQQQQQAPSPPPRVSCFGVAKEEHNQDGVNKQQGSFLREKPRPSTSSPIRRRVLVRSKPDIPAYLKLCGSTSSDSETSNLITPADSRDSLTEETDYTSCNPRRNTLDRLQKFRFGGGGSDRSKKSEGRSGKKKPPRSSDKTESLRELTEKLKGNSSNPDQRKLTPPIVNAGTSTTSHETSASAVGVLVAGKDAVNEEAANKSLGAVECSVGGGHVSAQSMSGVCNRAMDEEERTEHFKEDDLFECVNLKLPKPESRTIVGSYIQRTIPIRSASFSQVDFSPADGKYIRSSAKSSPFSGFTTSAASGKLPLSSSAVIAGGSLTLPRKKLPDITSAAVSPSSSTILGEEEPSGSTPSVDSAVGSDEGFLTTVIPEIPVVTKNNNSDAAHKTSGSRSLTYPLPGRGSRSDEDIPFSSIDGNGLKSLSYVPVVSGAGWELQEVTEESETSLSNTSDVPCKSVIDAGETMTDVGLVDLDATVMDNVSDVDEHESLPYVSDENVADPSPIEPCVGSNPSAECQQPQHPVQFASETLESDSTPGVCGESKTLLGNPQESDTDERSISQIERDINQLNDEIGDECAELDGFPNRHYVSDNNLIKETVDNNSREVTSDLNNGEGTNETEVCCEIASGCVDEVTCERSDVNEVETVNLSSQMSSDERSGEADNDEVVVSDEIKVWIAQNDPNNDIESNQNDVCFTIQIPSTHNILREGNKKDIQESLNNAQETDLVNPWQENVEANISEEAGEQMEVAKETVDNVTWRDSGGQTRWSGEGERTSNEWGSIQEESQSPEESSGKEQCSKRESHRRPRLVCQSSEEREDDSTRPSPRRYFLLARTDSLSEGESEQGDRCPSAAFRDRERDRTASPSFFGPSDVSDSEGRGGGGDCRSPRRYSKRPLRGPYGQMLEAEMKKPETNRMLSKLQYNEDLKFLEEYTSPPPQRPSSPTVSNSTRSSPAPTCADVTAAVMRPDNRPSNGRPRALTTQSLDDSQLKGGYGRSTPSTPTPTPHPRTSPKRKVSANIPYSAPNPTSETGRVFVCHQRTTSSPSQLEGYATSRREESPRPEPNPELVLRGSSERLYVPTTNSTLNGNSVHHWKDTRTHVVVELFETERSYVESLQILVMKYLKPLKSSENSGLVDSSLVDEIFFQVPAILCHHEVFLEELRKRLDNWDIKQTVGDAFLEAFTKQPVIETYTAFINNWKTAKEAIKATCQAKPAFARFLEAMAREHKGKLDLDSLLIMPVQRVPRYELLLQTLLKHTDPSHPDHQLLMEAQKEVHELAVKINCTERETLEYEQQQQTLKELEALIEGLINLVNAERTFVRHDMVTMASGQGTRKERALFLFSDLLVITSIKRRSGTIRKPSTSCPGSVAGTLEGNKYKLLMRIPLDDLEIVKAKDENLRRILREMENLVEDVGTLNQINDLTAMLHCPHTQLEDVVREMIGNVSKQLADRQNSDSQLCYLELTLNTQGGIENISVVFTKPDKKSSWEESFNEAKQKLALSADRRPSPEFVSPLPIRKTRAGLQFTCAAPTLGLNAYNMRDVWVCNSDGYVGQVCVLSLQPEPTVISCNGVCNARILCIASVPVNVAGPVSSSSSVSGPFPNSKPGISISVEDTDEGGGNIQLDSSSSSDDEDEPDDAPSTTGQGEEEQKRVRSASDSLTGDSGLLDDADGLQPTMWLGTEDGCIHVYNCSDNIRIKKNKVKIQHGSSVHCIIYLDNRVFVSLANGDITVYVRDQNSCWNTTDPYTVSVGTAATPVTRMLPIAGRLWCGCHNSVKILNTTSLEVEHSFHVNADSNRAVTCMAASGFGVWVSQQNSAIIRLFHSTSYDCLCDVNVAPAVTKMLASCDDIIRQHKAACLRVTSLLACKDLLWIGTSAGVILTMPLPHISASTSKLTSTPNATGVPHGHTGHVRFLTFVETSPSPNGDSLIVRPSNHHRYSLKNKPDLLSHQATGTAGGKLLVISGGDGYEDFRTSSVSEVAGREDSTNHLLLWHV